MRSAKLVGIITVDDVIDAAPERQDRVDNVKKYLVSKGIPSSKITTIGKGEAQPVATNKTKEGRQKNRRVDIEFKGVRK